MSRTLKLTVEGRQGSGKSTLLEVLREAGYEVSEERSDDGYTVEVDVLPPKRRTVRYGNQTERLVQ